MQSSLTVCLLVVAVLGISSVDAHGEKLFGILDRLLDEREKTLKRTIDQFEGEEQKIALEDLRNLRHVQDMMAKSRDELLPVMHELLTQLEHKMGASAMTEARIESGIKVTCSRGKLHTPEGFHDKHGDPMKRIEEFFPDLCAALQYPYNTAHVEL